MKALIKISATVYLGLDAVQSFQLGLYGSLAIDILCLTAIWS